MSGEEREGRRRLVGWGGWHHCAPADPRGESQGRVQDSLAKSRSPWWMQDGSRVGSCEAPIGASWTYLRVKKLLDLSMLSLLHGPPEAGSKLRGREELEGGGLGRFGPLCVMP